MAAKRAGYSPRARPLRAAQPVLPSEKGTPSGVLYWVLLDYWMSLPRSLRDSSGPIDCVTKDAGFYAMDGQGCDAKVNKADRCGERPCAYYVYRCSVSGVPAGVSLGVRACSEHADVAKEEKHWTREKVTVDLFAVHEVMTT